VSDILAIHDLARLDADARARLLVRSEADLSAHVAQVGPIIEAVRARGDAALAEFGRKFDGADIRADTLAAKPADFDAAEARLDDDLKAAMRFAADRIRVFHERQKPEDMWIEEMSPGVMAGERNLPIPSVACYVPRGKGAFPSVALMTTIPAVVAGVPGIVVLTPPTPAGGVDDATLYACRLAGVDKVYKCGGAQAVAAAAYGTETVPRCAKIVGPGSSWVVAAMRVLSDVIDTGAPAGPSESIVLADSAANPRKVALDLLNEAEHGPDSSAFLVTDSRDLADAVAGFVSEFWGHMSAQRVEFSRTVLSGACGGVVLAPDMDAACAFVDEYAPEHLMIHVADAWSCLPKLHNAGEILIGEHSAISIANFVLGPNHVLPTGGWARTRSPLSVFDFQKRQSIGYVTREGYSSLAPHAGALARYEGFDAHANAVSPLRDGNG
jgi:histidinol dehydrogenase